MKEKMVVAKDRHRRIYYFVNQWIFAQHIKN